MDSSGREHSGEGLDTQTEESGIQSCWVGRLHSHLTPEVSIPSGVRANLIYKWQDLVN